MSHVPEGDMSLLVRSAFDLAERAHAGQLYGKGPYIDHCVAVSGVLADHGFYEDKEVLAAGLLHDTLKNTRTTFDDIVAATSRDVADLVEACTGRGGNRHERNASISAKLACCPRAVPIRLADRLVNVHACWQNHDGRLFMYHAEYTVFRLAVTGALGLFSNRRKSCESLLFELDKAMCWRRTR